MLLRSIGSYHSRDACADLWNPLTRNDSELYVTQNPPELHVTEKEHSKFRWGYNSHIVLQPHQTCCPTCCPSESCGGKYSGARRTVVGDDLRGKAEEGVYRECRLYKTVRILLGETCYPHYCARDNCTRKHEGAGWMLR